MKNAFGWTQYNGHGPGDELLDEPRTALELSPAQTTAARTTWGHLYNAHYLVGDVLDFLTGTDRQWDAIYLIVEARPAR